MSTRPLRLGVLGAGSWTCVNHLPEIEKRDDVRFVVAMDTSSDRRARVAERFAFERVTGELDEALESELDIVIVGSTPDAHHPLVNAALQHGAHVLSEKPFCDNAEAAWELADLASRLDRHLLVAFGWNYQQIASDARALLTEHGIGSLEHAQIHMSTALREMYQGTMEVWGRPHQFMPVEGSYTRLAKGAGYAQAQVSHALGLALWLFPARAEQVFALMSHPGAEVDLHDAISLRTSDGATMSISGACSPLGARSNKHQLELRFFGSEGQLLLDLERERVWVYRSDGVDVEIPQPPEAGAYTGSGPATALVDLACGAAHSENRSSGELAARVTEAIQAAYASAQSQTLQRLPLPAGSRPTHTALP